MIDVMSHKWDAIYAQLDVESSLPVSVLTENEFLLPKAGTALDLACGVGANALFLARHGMTVTGWDISIVAIDKLSAHATRQGLNINACQEKINVESFTGSSFDVIVVSRFLDRTLSDAIIEALKPEGLLFYQTFTREKMMQTPP